MLGGIVFLRKIKSWMCTNGLSFVGTLYAKYGSIFISCQNLVIFWYEVDGKELLVNSKYAHRGNPVMIPVVSAMPSLVATYCIKEGSLTIISKSRWFNLWIRKCLPCFECFELIREALWLQLQPWNVQNWVQCSVNWQFWILMITATWNSCQLLQTICRDSRIGPAWNCWNIIWVIVDMTGYMTLLP